MGRTHHSNCRSCEKAVDTIDGVQLLHSDPLPSALPFFQSKARAKAKQQQTGSMGLSKLDGDCLLTSACLLTVACLLTACLLTGVVY